MALFSIDIEKSFQGEFWTNRYIVEATDLAQAQATSVPLVNAERQCHFSNITFTKKRISTTTEGDDVYIIQALDVQGNQAIGGSVSLPLFNVARVDFNVAVGRPSRKYLRTGFTAVQVNGQVFTAAYMTILQAYADAVAATAGFVDVDGQPIENGVAFDRVAMRQLRRGSRRRTTPVLPAA